MEFLRKKILDTITSFSWLCIQGITIVIAGMALYSCTSLRDISIEVAVLPEYPISEDVQSIAVLNRSLNMQSVNINSDSIEKILINKRMNMDSVFMDSTAADTAIQVAARALFESGRFDVVVPKERNILRDEYNEIGNPLDVNIINGICRDFNVDAVLILERFSEKLSTKYYYSNDEAVQFGSQLFSATTDVESKSDWRLYRPDNKKLVLRFQMGDSIFWKDTRYSLKELYSLMPRTKEALIGGGIASGLKIAKCISPSWVNQTRRFFMTGKPEIDQAVNLIKVNKWEEAAAIWAKYATTDKKKIRYKVEFNLALAAEMNGNLDLAIEWGLKSFKTHYSKPAEVYLRTLDYARQAKLKETKPMY